MKSYRLLMGALLISSLPTLAQPETKPQKGLPYPVVTPEEAVRLAEMKTIKLHLRDTTVRDALEEVEKQTGIPIETDFAGTDREEVLTKKVSLDLETASFKEATTAIFEKAEVKASLRRFGNTKRWSIYWGQDSEQKAPKSGIGPFQLQLQSLEKTTNKSVDLTEGETPVNKETSSLNGSIATETDPQLPLVGGLRLEITRAEDDKGRSLRSEQQFPYFERDTNFPQPISLKAPEPDAKSVAHLDGKATYVLATKREQWEVPDVFSAKDAAHDFQIGNNKVKVSIVSAKKINNDVEVEVAVKALGPVAAPAGEMQQARHPLLDFSQLTSAIKLVDAKGQTFDPAGYGGSSSGNELTGRLRYALRRVFVLPPQAPEEGQPITTPMMATLSGPVKLSMDVPSELVQTQVPFSFSNVPLPQ